MRDEYELENLFRHHWPSAYRAAYLVTHDAAASEDIAQEAFIAAGRALASFDRRRPFAPWLHRIVVNRAIDWTRARAARAEVFTAQEREEAPRGPEASGELVAALSALPPDQRAVVVLRYLLEYTPGEIAGILELPRGTVNSRLRRALDALGTRLERER